MFVNFRVRMLRAGWRKLSFGFKFQDLRTSRFGELVCSTGASQRCPIGALIIDRLVYLQFGYTKFTLGLGF